MEVEGVEMLVKEVLEGVYVVMVGVVVAEAVVVEEDVVEIEVVMVVAEAMVVIIEVEVVDEVGINGSDNFNWQSAWALYVGGS